MAVAGCNADGYIRCCKALHLVVHQCIPCVDNVLRNWHKTKQQSLPPCSRPRPRPPSNLQECSDKGKPKLSSSCSNCVAWGKAVEDAYYPQTERRKMPWGNINPMCLSESHIEVAKAFVLRLQKDKQFTKLDQFDAASLLMIMMRFEEFHRADQIKFDIIKKVSEIRNTLCHMQLEDNLHLESQQVDDIFSAINDLVSCLETLHPQWFTTYHAQDLRRQLNETKTGPVTAQMKEILEEFSTTMKEAVKHGIQEEHRSIREREEQKDVMGNKKMKMSHAGQKTFDAQTCRNQLMAEYRQTRSKLPLLPGMPNECADMDDLYVELELIKEEKRTFEVEKTKLSSQEDLLTLKDKRGNAVKRILVRGGPGSGKTSTISKLAYDWANEKKAPAYTQFQMLFALDLREIQSGMNLIDAIQDQLLPKVSKELMSYIEAHAKSVVFLLDGFDEASSMEGSDIKHLLSSKWLQESLVIVTTRPHKVADFVSRSRTTYYLHVKLTGFSKAHKKEYVLRFFKVQSEYIVINKYHNYEMKSSTPVQIQENVQDIVSFLNKLETSKFLSWCQTPIILTMLCVLWNEDKQALDQKVTDLYKQVVTHLANLHLAKYRQEKYNKGEENEEFLQPQLDVILFKIGKVALSGLFEDKLIFHSNEFDKGILEDACHFGIVSEERKRSKLRAIDHVTFFHKTFQEYCAAFHWASLIENDPERFLTYLQQIHTGNVSDMEKLLQFCCGTNSNAADKILPHVVRLSCDMIRSEPPGYESGTVACDDRWDFPLAIFHEAGVQQMHTHLLPLFDWQTLLKTSHLYINNEGMVDRLNALNFFLDCVLDNTSSLSNIWKGVNTVYFSYLCSNMEVYLKYLSCISEITTLAWNCEGDALNKLIRHDMPWKKQIRCFEIGDCIYKTTYDSKTLENFLKQLTSLTSLKLHNVGLVNGTATQILDAISHYKLLELAIRNRVCIYSLHPFIPTLQRLEIDLCCDSKTSSRASVDQFCHGEGSTSCKCQCKCDSQCDSRKLFSTFVEIGSKLSETTSNTLVNNDVSVTGMAQPVLPCESLILYRFEISDKNVGQFVEAFKYLGNLVELGLHKLSVSDTTSFQMIMSNIRTLPRLEKLDLSDYDRDVGQFGNEIKDLCHGFMHLKKLTHLDLHFIHLNEGMSKLGLSLTYMPDLQVLDLSHNDIGSGMVDLCHGLKHLTKLRELDLSDNKITDEGITMLPLEQLTDLRELKIDLCKYGPQGVEHLFRNLHHVSNLEVLKVDYACDFHEENEFLRECYQACSLSTIYDMSDYELEIQNHDIIHSVVLFAKKYH